MVEVFSLEGSMPDPGTRQISMKVCTCNVKVESIKTEPRTAFRLLGTANHCLEDYTAHSNYCELVLIELGERGVFPHVGRQTQVNLPGTRQPVYPIVTGTFGGVDFLHSVMVTSLRSYFCHD